MTSKRLLDATRLLSASRTIAQHHLAIRSQQWDVFTRTSSLAKAIKSQTDRVTVTARAAAELAKRFAEDEKEKWRDERSPEAARESNFASTADATIKTTSSSGAVDDETIASATKNRQAQRRAEDQIPGVTSDAQEPSSGEAVGGGETFGERPQHTSPELSSLPRLKLPKEATSSSPAAVGEATNKGSSAGAINPDVFPSPDSKTKFEEARLEEMLHNPGMDGLRKLRERSSGANPYAGREKVKGRTLAEMVRVEEERERRQEREQGENLGEVGVKGMDKETEKLAGDLAQDATSSTAAASPSAAAGVTQEPKPYEMRESRVPSSRFGRLWQYGGLATGMAFGAVGEGFRRITGGSGEGSVMMSEGNINRLVAKLSRMRGAALKLGQMMSFQDSNFLPPTINMVLQRVQDSADYMPASQRDKVLVRNLGADWRELFAEFEEKPFAAASIGQVHKATLKASGKEVAVKIQYPGVRNSIDSDLNNLSLLLTASQLLPKGLYLDKTIANARTELAWECDYEREAKAGIRFRDELLVDEHDIFTVPTVFTEASGSDVLTAEFMHGKAVTKIPDLTQPERDWIGTQILRICWRELMEWRFMQTDPNWTNFLYNRSTHKIELLDFGASRDFPDKFVVPYVELLIAASKGDRETCRSRSIELGYLTGHESKSMLDAHVDSIMVLAEPFGNSAPDVYDFENQTITDRVRANIGLMLRERLAPPPEETYSLHRKLSGAFLLCAKLRSRVRTRKMFEDAVGVWEGRGGKVGIPGT